MEDIRQDFEPSQSKRYLYELQVGAWFQKAGFLITFEEPDLRISNNGLTDQIGLACKYPSSEKKLEKRISEGYEQIDRHGIPGLVVVGMDILCCRGMKKFVEFPDRKEVILESLANELGQWVTKTIKRRAGLKGHRPLDGALFTLSMAGIVGKPAGLTIASQMTFQSGEDNPLNAQIAVIRRPLEGWVARAAKEEMQRVVWDRMSACGKRQNGNRQPVPEVIPLDGHRICR